MDNNTNQEILAELKKLRIHTMLLLTVIAVAFIVFAPSHNSSTTDSWAKVRMAVEQENFPAALSMAQTLVARQPDYYYGHSYLGHIYLAMGDATNAETQYSQAYQLFPNEENDKDLAAVRKRLATAANSKMLSK